MTLARLGLPLRGVEVIDGDTLKVTLELHEYIRVLGIDTPEFRQAEQREAAIVVTQAVKKWMEEQADVAFIPVDYDKYGQRIVCVVKGDKGDLASFLLEQGLAQPYDGKKKAAWTAKHLKAICDKQDA